MSAAQYTPGKDTRPWCLHHIGADEIHAAPDFATAQSWANWANQHFAMYADISRFVVAVWPWDAEKHAAALPRSVAGWTVPDAAPPAANDGEPFTLTVEEIEAGRKVRAFAKSPHCSVEDHHEIMTVLKALERRATPTDQSKFVEAMEEIRETLRNGSYGGEPARYRNARASLQLYTLIEQIRGENPTCIRPSEVPY